MFCPGCGADGQTANAYCKRCGDWLPEFKRRSSAFGGETPQQNIFTGLFLSALSAIVALFSVIALYATYLGTDEAKWSIYLAAAFSLCIAGWQASSFVVGLKLRSRQIEAQTFANPALLEIKKLELQLEIERARSEGIRNHQGPLTIMYGQPGVQVQVPAR